MGGVLADDFVQGPVQQVGDGVVALDGGAARAVDRATARTLGPSSAARHGPTASRRFATVPSEEMQPGVAGFLGVGDAPELAAVLQFAGVADLAAHFGVEGRGVENDGGLVL